jgi:hypothetical protein
MKRAPRLLTAMLAVSLCFAGILTDNTPAYAVNGLTVSPPLKEVTLGPGLIETATYVTLQNNTSQSIRAHLQLADLRALGEYGGTSLDKAGLSDKYDLADWMTLPSGDTVIIASGETLRVKVDIANRSDLAPGGHYGAVVITSSSDNSVKSDVNINQQLVSLLFIKKLGGEVYGLQLESQDYKKTSGIPQEVTTRFKGTGNVHVIPRGYIEVTDPVGKVVAKGIINEDSNIVLPDKSRQFVSLMNPIAAADRSGRYKVTVYYRYDGQKDFSSQTTYFDHGTNLVPYMAGGVIAISGLATGVYFIFRNKRKAFK